MGTQEVLRVLRRRWFFIVVAAVLGTVLGLVWAATRTPEYTAQADVFITVTSGESTGDLASGSNFSQQQARNFAVVVTREVVLAPVIEKLHLNTTVDELRDQINVQVPLNTSLVTIQATDTNAQTAADIANAAATNLSVAVGNLSPKVSDVKGSPVSAKQIETAVVPVEPSSPNIPLLAIFGLLAGLVLGIAYLVITELVVAKIDSAEQAIAITGGSILASVPRDRKLSRHPIAVTAIPLSRRAEKIRQLRTALKFLPGGDRKVFVITSSISGEGKTTTSGNIAAAFAAEGVSTCLVEADVRRPRLEGMLDLTGGAGLSDVIVGETPIEDAVQSWGPDNLQVILAGTVPPNASELLGSPRGQDVLRQITERYDVTIIDSPPLTAVTDASIIGRMFGGVVLVVGEGLARASELRKAADSLKVADVPLLGTVLNRTKDEASSPYVYSYADTSRSSSRLATALPKEWAPVIKVAAAAAMVIAVTIVTVLMAGTGHRATSASAVIPSTDAATVAATTTKAVFMGDSLVTGAGGGGTTWTSLVAKNLGWDEVNLGRAGTGYLKSADASTCGQDSCPLFAMMAKDVIAQSPDVVVISGGAADASSGVDVDVREGAKALFTTLRGGLPQAKIIVLSPLSLTLAPPATLDRVRDQVKAQAKAAGVTYVDLGDPLAGRTDLFTADGRTPNATGYKELADVITKALKKL